MGYGDEHKPGDLSVRIAFSRAYGTGPDAGKVMPRIEIMDQTSGKTIEVELSAEQFTEVMSGSEARVPAEDVTGFKGLLQWGKYHKHTTRMADVKLGDYEVTAKDVKALPHIAVHVEQLEADGYTVEQPHRNNGGKWVITGRRYDDEP